MASSSGLADRLGWRISQRLLTQHQRTQPALPPRQHRAAAVVPFDRSARGNRCAELSFNRCFIYGRREKDASIGLRAIHFGDCQILLSAQAVERIEPRAAAVAEQETAAAALFRNTVRIGQATSRPASSTGP